MRSGRMGGGGIDFDSRDGRQRCRGGHRNTTVVGTSTFGPRMANDEDEPTGRGQMWQVLCLIAMVLVAGMLGVALGVTLTWWMLDYPWPFHLPREDWIPNR